MSIIQSTATERNIYLTAADVPALGVLPADVVCKYRKAGQTALTTKALSVSNWIEVGSGFYILKFTEAEMNTLGYFFYTLEGTDFDNFLYDEFTIEPAVAAGGEVIEPDSCVVSGSFRTAGNKVPANARVTFRPVAFPTSAGTSIVSGDTVVTYLDAYGNFSVSLLQGVTVILEVESTGLRHQITIPYTSEATLLSLLPTLPYTI
jgi:hypothetical protein